MQRGTPAAGTPADQLPARELAGGVRRKRGARSGSEAYWRMREKREAYPQINRAIVAAAEKLTLPQLLDKVRALIPEMNLVNLATSVHRIARLSTTAQARLKVQNHPVVPELSTAMQMMLQRRMTNLDAPPTCQALSNITWGLATIEYVDMQLLPMVTALVVNQIEEFKSFELSALLWAFAKLGELEPMLNPYSLPTFRLAASLIHRNVASFPFRSLIMTIWAFATMKECDEGLFHVIAPRLLCEVQSASCEEVVKIVRAYAVAGILPEQLLEQVAGKVLHNLVEFKPAELGRLLSDYAEFGLLKVHFLSERILQERITDPALLHLLESFFTTEENEHKRAAVSQLFDEASQRVASMKQIDFQALVRVCDAEGCSLGTTPSVEVVIHGCRLLAAMSDFQSNGHVDVDILSQGEVGASSDSDTSNDDKASTTPMSASFPCSPPSPGSSVSTQASLPPSQAAPHMGSDQTWKEADTAATQELRTGAETWHLAQNSCFGEGCKDQQQQGLRGGSVDPSGGEVEVEPPAGAGMKSGQMRSVTCTVKNTFLHFQEESRTLEDEDLDNRLLELPAELAFIPAEVKGHGGLMAFRMRYRQSRISRTASARGARVA